MKPATYLLLSTCLFCFAIEAFGAPVGSKAAAATVKGWLQMDRKPLGKAMGATGSRVETFKGESGEPLYHVVNLEPTGFVIVSAEDQTEPVIAFVQRGRFDPSPNNPLGALIGRDLPARVAHARAHGGTPAALKNRAQWQKLQANAAGGVQPNALSAGSVSDLRVAPFIQTTWDQANLSITVNDLVLVSHQVVITTHFVTNALGDRTSTSLGFSTHGTMPVTDSLGNPSIGFFGGQSASVDVTNGPDGTVTNLVLVTDAINIVVTNAFGQILANQTWVTNTTLTNIVSGIPGTTVTKTIGYTVSQYIAVGDSKVCYNYFTPPHEPGNVNNYYCGCVATAMAQLMYYFQSPSTGVGMPCFPITVDGKSMGRNLRGGNGNGGPYDWRDMPPTPSYYSITPLQAQSVGALTYDAGVAVKMQYGINGSSAYMTDAKAALVNTFKYNNAIVNAVTNLDTGCFECSLFKMMNPNLDARLPVLLGITGDPGGHAIVCDGYGYYFGAPYHHLNMGWGGAYDAWYALPIIDMVRPDGSYTYFWNVTDCIYNVFTNGSGEIISGRVLDVAGAPIPNASITAIGTKGSIYRAATDANGIYALVGVPSASTFTLTVTNAGYFPVSSNYTTTTSLDFGTSSGNVWGANFTLVAAQGPPAITTQPQDQTVTVGTNVTFSVTTGGQLPLVYQWQYLTSGSLSWNDLSDGGHYSGAGTDTLTVSQTDTSLDGQPLRCVISNSLGTATSSQANLRVIVAPFVEISTIAGLAGAVGSGDGVGTNALFNNPRGIAVDNNTNVYVADMYNHVIRKLALLETNWVVSTIAGLAGNPGSTDDTNEKARFNGPYGVAVDGGGNVYVADTGNSTIRKLTPSGTNWVVSTISGLAGNPGSTNGSGSVARFRYPTGLAVDGAGNVYVADQGNSTIRKLTSSGATWMASTIAGTAGHFGSADGTNDVARFGEPYGVAVDNSGNVYVVDKYSDTIRKLTPSGINWVVTTIAGLAGGAGSSDGISSDARFNNPTGIAAGGDGNVYVADYGNNTVRRMSPAGTNWMVFTIAGLAGNSGSTDGIGAAVRFNGPFGIAVDNNTNIYVSDSISGTIRMDPLIAASVPSFVQLVKQQAGGTLALAWSAMAGHAYQVQFKTDVNQSVWSNLTSITPSSWTGVVPVSTEAAARRFYRVVPVR